tara:strand:+ start:61 stop:1209 length:1149 start_codon:yes stop_codon:yes gene_type:complete
MESNDFTNESNINNKNICIDPDTNSIYTFAQIPKNKLSLDLNSSRYLLPPPTSPLPPPPSPSASLPLVQPGTASSIKPQIQKQYVLPTKDVIQNINQTEYYLKLPLNSNFKFYHELTNYNGLDIANNNDNNDNDNNNNNNNNNNDNDNKYIIKNISQAIAIQTDTKNQNSPSTISSGSSCNAKKQIFLSHTWKKDNLNRNNHIRAKFLADKLKKLGYTVWFDEYDITVGNIDASMIRGINNCECFIVCVTEKYLEKINQAANNIRIRDNCYKEFNYANSINKAIIPILLEPNKKLINSYGLLNFYLANNLFIDFGFDFGNKTNLNKSLRKLSRALKKIGVEPFISNCNQNQNQNLIVQQNITNKYSKAYCNWFKFRFSKILS